MSWHVEQQSSVSYIAQGALYVFGGLLLISFIMAIGLLIASAIPHHDQQATDIHHTRKLGAQANV